METAQRGDTVHIHYQGTSQDGEIFASSREGKPVKFTLGEGKVISGIEEAVVGMREGESKTVQLPARKAYGERREELVATVNREDVSRNESLDVGQRVRFQKKDGTALDAKVTDISDSTVTVDANHLCV
ncbi:peptidylprolyl isomerase [Thermodesulfobacteriota bacterium]